MRRADALTSASESNLVLLAFLSFCCTTAFEIFGFFFDTELLLGNGDEKLVLFCVVFDDDDEEAFFVVDEEIPMGGGGDYLIDVNELERRTRDECAASR